MQANRYMSFPESNELEIEKPLPTAAPSSVHIWLPSRRALMDSWRYSGMPNAYLQVMTWEASQGSAEQCGAAAMPGQCMAL